MSVEMQGVLVIIGSCVFTVAIVFLIVGSIALRDEAEVRRKRREAERKGETDEQAR